MKTIKIQAQRCMACGGKLVNSKDHDENFTCEKCGEEYDLEILSKMELEFDEFDKLLLLDLKMRRRKNSRLVHLVH